MLLFVIISAAKEIKEVIEQIPDQLESCNKISNCEKLACEKRVNAGQTGQCGLPSVFTCHLFSVMSQCSSVGYLKISI